jgi:hypothetical protein
MSAARLIKTLLRMSATILRVHNVLLDLIVINQLASLKSNGIDRRIELIISTLRCIVSPSRVQHIAKSSRLYKMRRDMQIRLSFDRPGSRMDTCRPRNLVSLAFQGLPSCILVRRQNFTGLQRVLVHSVAF